MSKLPFSEETIKKILSQYPTPLYLYDEVGILKTAKTLNATYSWVADYKNYYASKALPNPHIHKLLKDKAEMGIDTSSFPELVLAEKVGFKGDEIMFSSNDTPVNEFKKAAELNAIINFDDISFIEYYLKNVGPLPELVCFRYNPGNLRASGGNEIIGNPADAKYGLTHKQMFEAYKLAKEKGAKRFGIHTMIASNETRFEAHVETADTMFHLVREIEDKLNIRIEFINLGGGLGIPYSPEDKPVDTKMLGQQTKELYEKVFSNRDNKPNVVTEHGRYVTGPNGYLIVSVRHIKNTYKNYIGTDGSMANLMRPGMYGAYHEISVLGKENLPANYVYDVVGSLCENNDKFAIDRKLPKIDVDDILVIHNAGAHGHAMGFNYNGKLRSAEVLVDANGHAKLIRRAETIDDYFATLV